MFKTLWKALRDTAQYFFPDTVPEQTLDDRYHEIYLKVRGAKTLGALIASRKSIRAFHRDVIDAKMEARFRTRVMEVNSLWDAKYKYWKLKTRGY